MLTNFDTDLCDWCELERPESELRKNDHFDIWYCEGCADDVAESEASENKYGSYAEQVRREYYASR